MLIGLTDGRKVFYSLFSSRIIQLFGCKIMDMVSKIKVLIVDDHLVVRRGLKALLETFDDFEVVGDTPDGRLALALCNTYLPDVIITDLLMPLMDGLSVIRLILGKFPRIQVVVLTSSVDESLIRFLDSLLLFLKML